MTTEFITVSGVREVYMPAIELGHSSLLGSYARTCPIPDRPL